MKALVQMYAKEEDLELTDAGAIGNPPTRTGQSEPPG